MSQMFRDMEGVKKILDVAIAQQQREHDSTFLIGGALGTGKSNFMLDCIDYIDLVKEEQTPIKNVALDIRPFITALATNLPKSLIVLDEGRDLAAVNHMDKMNKAIIKAFEVMRKRSYITFICFSNPSRMQGYFKEDRIRGMFFITKRGHVWYFSSFQLVYILDQFIKLKNRSIHNFSKFEPRFKDTFPIYTGNLKNAYDKLKDDTIINILGSLNDEYGVEEELPKDYIPTKTAFKMIGFKDVKSIKRLVQKGELVPIERNVRGEFFFTKEELDRFVAERKEKYPLFGNRKDNVESGHSRVSGIIHSHTQKGEEILTQILETKD